jgi:hypothetical protein
MTAALFGPALRRNGTGSVAGRRPRRALALLTGLATNESADRGVPVAVASLLDRALLVEGDS